MNDPVYQCEVCNGYVDRTTKQRVVRDPAVVEIKTLGGVRCVECVGVVVELYVFVFSDGVHKFKLNGKGTSQDAAEANARSKIRDYEPHTFDPDDFVTDSISFVGRLL